MADDTHGFGTPNDLGAALARVRALLDETGMPERTVAWAMIIEAVNRLSVLHGPMVTAGLLDQLSRAVIETPAMTAH